MAFKQVVDLDCEVTTALGGVNKKTGKANPTRVEGYYVGRKEVDSPKAKTGKAYLYILQTNKGNLGVWGKTDLDRKMSSATLGAMTRITQSGMSPTKNGDMYKFTVEVDADNTIEVSAPDSGYQSASNDDEDDYLEETSLDSEDDVDVAPPAPAARTSRPAATPTAASVAAVRAQLSGRK